DRGMDMGSQPGCAIRGLTSRATLGAFLGLFLAGAAGVAAMAEESPPPVPVFPGPPPVQLLCLVGAYPDHLVEAHWVQGDGWAVKWKDGTLMDWDDGRGEKDFETLLNEPDLQDMMSISYPVGKEYSHPTRDDDPGRIRYDPFFRKMYGDSSKEVQSRLVQVRWLPESGGKKLRVMSVNGVNAALARVSEEIAKLPRKIRDLAAKTSGPFNWRVIKGTKRLSSHSFAIALDVAVEHAHYWRWSRKDKDGNYPYRNEIPLEIVEAFERNGFVWGGKWYHYDTMHFEYRPDLLDPRCVRKATD
ncbi:MAG: M15 family metallopeptidase, partial [Gemmatimonadota bacterium]